MCILNYKIPLQGHSELEELTEKLKSELDEKIELLDQLQNGDQIQNNMDDLKRVSKKWTSNALKIGL